MSTASATFNQICEQALAQAGQITPAARDCIIEDLRLRFEYPAQYVAYVDHFETTGKVRRLTRTVLAHSSDLEAIQQALQAYSHQELQGLVVDYIDPPENDLTIPHDIIER